MAAAVGEGRGGDGDRAVFVAWDTITLRKERPHRRMHCVSVKSQN